MPKFPMLTGVVGLLMLSPALVLAQETGAIPSQPLVAVAPAAAAAAPAPATVAPPKPLLGVERLGVSQPVAVPVTTNEPAAPVRRAGLRHRGPGVALMIVGAAGVITGLLIEESLITILGAGTGLIGLYLYVR